MRNKYGHRLHISERKFREVLKLFCADLTATKIAELTSLNRNTINAILSRMRDRTALMAERESCFQSGEVEIDESYFGARRAKGKRGRGAAGKTIVFGMKKRGGNVYTQIVKNCSASELLPIIRAHAPEDSVIYSDEWKAYDGLVNFGYREHHRVKHSSGNFANGRAHINGIENFWGAAKTRMAKFRGFDKKNFLRHLKETEFRFNHRQENLYKLLLKEFRTSPL
jgi:transposase